MALIRDELNSAVATLQVTVDTHGSTIKDLERSATSCSDDLGSLNKTVKALKDELKVVKNQIKGVQAKCDDLEGRSRRNNIRLLRAEFGSAKRLLRACPGVKFGLFFPAELRITLPGGALRACPCHLGLIPNNYGNQKVCPVWKAAEDCKSEVQCKERQIKMLSQKLFPLDNEVAKRPKWKEEDWYEVGAKTEHVEEEIFPSSCVSMPVKQEIQTEDVSTPQNAKSIKRRQGQDERGVYAGHGPQKLVQFDVLPHEKGPDSGPAPVKLHTPVIRRHLSRGRSLASPLPATPGSELHLCSRVAVTHCYAGALVSDRDHLLPSVLEQAPSAECLLIRIGSNDIKLAESE
ncbi:hypothetical protein AAFF_G00151810 [Aldrovandia affinis]|uniref:Uncharacterized protein n=1 Tax=Aldrovandia affinis TaxID=143900 RepID=A0AAD7RNQ8_9TELE|nr:hypothetical protein AAFF_G00151810 [Aldrovandia affinis]